MLRRKADQQGICHKSVQLGLCPRLADQPLQWCLMRCRLDRTKLWSVGVERGESSVLLALGRGARINGSGLLSLRVNHPRVERQKSLLRIPEFRSEMAASESRTGSILCSEVGDWHVHWWIGRQRLLLTVLTRPPTFNTTGNR
jgi:hypothetical protein